jgi:hypothetical protein
MKRLVIVLLILASLPATAQDTSHTKPVRWNGYSQFSFTSNFNEIHSFAMRRMKLWVYKKPGKNSHWGFKVQTTITSFQNQHFLLQDVEAYYVHKNISINFGQFVPEYSLQRFQPDFIIPLTERSPVINALIPNAKLGVRDIGMQLKYAVKNMQTWIGIFNGNGIKTYKLNNNGFMITNKTRVQLIKQHILLGYSFMFRKADQLPMTNILPDSVAFSGNDIRYNLFAQYNSQHFNIQAEYLYTNLGGKVADGYYVLASIDFAKNQMALSWNQYHDLIAATGDAPSVHLGYNYLMNGNKLKLMFDNGIQIEKGKLKNYMATLQFQFFFK